ncbi:hypothetical protein [Candidatus Spongiihabitans sp.]|uniref:hypothetical protein n=1 Tax=Candidatus Spongiihabitans sp. TaxID=3101308 RepID=UPI003C6F8F85
MSQALLTKDFKATPYWRECASTSWMRGRRVPAVVFHWIPAFASIPAAAKRGLRPTPGRFHL